jgi:hypothetical protein
VAPVLEAVWKAGGLEDAHVWFLTGHTVAEVYYDGAYHYYDSDMMGYNTVGHGPAKQSPVASVHQIEQNGNIILTKLKSPTEVDAALVEAPWYPADLREAAIGDLAGLFTTTANNWLFPFERAPQGHQMNFELRPGESLVRYYQPEVAALAYLPYKFTGNAWEEFPQEAAQYQIRTEDGPRSQKDGRRWATGALEYRLSDFQGTAPVFDVHSPYVIIDALFEFNAALSTAGQTVTVETSADDGRTWTPAGKLQGPHQGAWHTEPAVLTRSKHGRRTAISGSYDYLVRVRKVGKAELRDGLLRTRVQLNPRTLPELVPGRNEVIYTAGPPLVRRAVAASPTRVENGRYISDGAQGYWIAASGQPANFLFHLTGPGGAALSGFDAGGRFLDLSNGLAPDKFTAEVRKVAAVPARRPAASIAWSNSPEGPFKTIWEYDPHLKWNDGVAIDRTLLWPEVDRHVDLAGASGVYVRYRIQELAVDNFRLATETRGREGPEVVEVIHLWNENGTQRRRVVRIPTGASEYRYTIEIPGDVKLANEAIIIDCKGSSKRRRGTRSVTSH